MWVLSKFLTKVLKRGRLTLIDVGGKVHEFGRDDAGYPHVVARFTDRWTPGRIARQPRLGFGEAWMDGRFLIEQGDLRDLLKLIRGNASWEGGKQLLRPKGPIRQGIATLAGKMDRLNYARRARRNVAHHYDLDDRLYDLFLDADRQYSCAYFTDPGNSLEQAQSDKKAHIAAKLDLKPGQHVLDIGCGWGGMALYLNRIADVDVLGITLSEEQLKGAREIAAAAGVADRVRFELIDYRKVDGRFDRIVSVGMFEHVGPPHYREFFLRTRNLLTDEGIMLLHTIGRMGGPGTTDPFTSKYIFPGGYIPALSEIVAASEPTRMFLCDVEILRLHYALTLKHWYDRTMAARERIVALYDERFFRLWQFYLAGAESAFRHGGLVNFQLQYARSRTALPLTRDYLAVAEQELRIKGDAGLDPV